MLARYQATLHPGGNWKCKDTLSQGERASVGPINFLGHYPLLACSVAYLYVAVGLATLLLGRLIPLTAYYALMNKLLLYVLGAALLPVAAHAQAPATPKPAAATAPATPARPDSITGTAPAGVSLSPVTPVANSTALKVRAEVNPVTNRLSVRTDAAGPMRVEVNDSGGRPVITKTVLVGNKPVELNVSQLPAGSYVVRCTAGEKTGTRLVRLGQ